MSFSATLLAIGAIFMWSFLAYLGARLSHLPPFLVVGIALCISGGLSLWSARHWRVSLKILSIGVGGIFGYHFLYFSAFQYAPAVEVNLMNYLWPLSIVLLSPLYLQGYRLRSHHLIGALMGLGGAALIFSGGRLGLDMAHVKGYLLAGGAAITWASYSLLSKRLAPFPTAAVGAFCLISGFLSLLTFGLMEGYASLASLEQGDWISLILLGAGPMGAAFFTWDAALKRGDPRVIGSLAYLTPMSSTLVLVTLGGKELTWITIAAMILIVGGALVGSADLMRKSTPPPTAVKTSDIQN